MCVWPHDKSLYSENEMLKLDNCTTCTCKNGLILCYVNECPIITCSEPKIDQTKSCCPFCHSTENVKNEISLEYTMVNKFWSCLDSKNQVRSHGSSWKENDCLACECKNGKSVCFDYSDRCTKLDCELQVIKKGECCPYCLNQFSKSMDSKSLFSLYLK
jgi:hypothetical protein